MSVSASHIKFIFSIFVELNESFIDINLECMFNVLGTLAPLNEEYIAVISDGISHSSFSGRNSPLSKKFVSVVDGTLDRSSSCIVVFEPPRMFTLVPIGL